MKKDKLGKFLSILGKIIALTSVVLFMLKMIPANGIIQWSMFVADFLSCHQLAIFRWHWAATNPVTAAFSWGAVTRPGIK